MAGEFNDIATWLKGVMDPITDIGQVYDYEPAVDTIQEMIDTFSEKESEAVLKFWLLGHGTCRELWESNINTKAQDSIVIRGYYARKGATTEKSQRDLVEDIRQAFRDATKPVSGGDLTMGGNVRRPTMPAVSAQRFEVLGGVLCHYIELTIGWDAQHTG